MLKSAALFAVSGLAVVMLAPAMMPMLDRASKERAPTTAAVSTPAKAAAEPVAYPSSEPTSGYRELQIPANSQNQYYVDALVNGVSVRFMVDTGATYVSLSQQVAEQLGLYQNLSSPRFRLNTANGSTIGYGVKLNSIDFGSIYMSDVDAVVQPNLGPINLLGENFLHRLSSVEQREGHLVLRQ